MNTLRIKTALQSLAAASVLATGAAFAEPTLVNDDAWLVVRAAPAPRAAAQPIVEHAKHGANRVGALDFLAAQPISYGE